MRMGKYVKIWNEKLKEHVFNFENNVNKGKNKFNILDSIINKIKNSKKENK